MVVEKLNKIIPGVTVSDENFASLANVPLGSLQEAMQLNLFIEPEHVSFALKNISKNEFVHLQSFDLSAMKTREEKENAIEKLLIENEWLKKNYTDVHVGISNHLLTIVPETFFDSAQPELYINFNLELPQHSKIQVDDLKFSSSKLIFALSQKTESALRLNYQNCKINHATTSLLQELSAKADDVVGGTPTTTLHVYVEPNQVQLIIFSNGKLKFYNCFQYRSVEDYTYHLLNVCNQLLLDKEKVKVVLLGEVMKNSDIFNMSYKYIRNVSFGARPDGKNFSAAFNFPEHFYYNLFSL